MVGFDARLSAAGVSVAVGVGERGWFVVGDGLGVIVGLGKGVSVAGAGVGVSVGGGVTSKKSRLPG